MSQIVYNYRKRYLISSFLLLQISLLSFVAKGEGYCVACYSPDAVYQCLIEGTKNTSSVDPRHQILCIKLIAKEGGHTRCSVERFTHEGCKGAVRLVDADTSTLKSKKEDTKEAGHESPSLSNTSPVASKDEQGNTPSEPQELIASEKTSDGSIENLTKSTAQATKNGLGAVTGAIKETTVKTGEKILSFANTVGQVTKKTWKCVTTFFSDC